MIFDIWEHGENFSISKWSNGVREIWGQWKIEAEQISNKFCSLAPGTCVPVIVGYSELIADHPVAQIPIACVISLLNWLNNLQAALSYILAQDLWFYDISLGPLIVVTQRPWPCYKLPGFSDSWDHTERLLNPLNLHFHDYKSTITGMLLPSSSAS